MNQMYLKMSTLFLAVTLILSSCASIVSKSSYPLSINSTPNNATISIKDKSGLEVYRGTTPAVVKLTAGSGFFSRAEYQVRFSSPGYEEKVVPVIFELDGWYFGNILLGGVIGMLIVDPATGAMWKIDSEHINETLTSSTATTNAEMKIMDIDDVPDSLKDYLVQIN